MEQSAWVCREEAVDVRVELAVCKLLLGRRQEAEAELCLYPDAPRPPDRAVQDFILVSLHPPTNLSITTYHCISLPQCSLSFFAVLSHCMCEL